MIKIKEQLVDSEDICSKVIGKVFGDDAIFSIDEYDKICTIIEETLMCVKEYEKC